MSSAEVGSSSTTKRGLQHHGAGDGDALALAAGELVRVAVLVGRVEADLLQDGRDHGPPPGRRRRPAGAAPGLRRRSGPTDRRGLRLPYGSWKTICISRRSGPQLARAQALDLLAVEADRALARRSAAAAPGRAWSCRSRSRRPRPTVWPGAHRQRDAVDRLDVADRAAQQAALDREMHLEVLGRHDHRRASDRPAAARPSGSAASRWRV